MLKSYGYLMQNPRVSLCAISMMLLCLVCLLTCFCRNSYYAKFVLDRYNEKLTEARKISIKGASITAISQSISWMLIFFFSGTLIWYAGILVADGETAPGTIVQVRALVGDGHIQTGTIVQVRGAGFSWQWTHTDRHHSPGQGSRP